MLYKSNFTIYLEIIVSTKSRNQTCAPSSDGWIHISATGGAGGFYYAV